MNPEIANLIIRERNVIRKQNIRELQCFTDGLRPNGFNAFKLIHSIERQYLSLAIENILMKKT